MKQIITFVFLLGILSSINAQNTRKVLIIGIDGARGDAVVAANTPNMDALAANGIASYEAQTLPITYSGPGWSTILTGVWMDKHEVTENTFIPNNLAEYPHFFQRIKEINADLYTASIVHWSPINIFLTPLTTTDEIGTYGTDVEVRDAAVTLMNSEDPDATFLHFDDIDGAGHSSGFTPDNPVYISAIETVDEHIGAVMTAIQNRVNYVNEDWLIIVCTDHGGEGTNHGCNLATCQDIFYIASSDLITPELLEKTVVNMPLPAAVSLDGNDDYIEIPNASQHDFDGENFTIEIRLKTNGWSGDAPIISNKDWDSGFNDGFIISGNTDGSTWKFNMGDGAITRMDMDGGTINDNEYHHIAVSLDRTGRSFTWQDGYVQEFNATGFLFDSDSDLPLVIGQDGTLNYDDNFNGLISEIRIWNTNLRNITLNEWNCKAITPDHPNYGNLVGLWKVDEGTGNMINDASSFGESGTLMNGPTWDTSNSAVYVCTDYSGVPDNSDIVPTAMNFLCLDIEESWGIDGRSFATEVNCTEPTVTCEDLSIQSVVVEESPTNSVLHITLNNTSGEWAAYPQMTVEFENNPYIESAGDFVGSVLSENGTTELYPPIFLLGNPPEGTMINGIATLYVAELELTCIFPFSILLPTTSGINQNLNPSIRIYPNITNHSISYDLGNVTESVSYQLFSTNGQLIINETNINDQGIINLQDVSAGMYFLMMENEKGELIFRDKIIKE